jgi:hypothetical protein
MDDSSKEKESTLQRRGFALHLKVSWFFEGVGLVVVLVVIGWRVC